MSIMYAREGQLGVVTIDDGKVNAMNQAFFDGLNAALDAAERDGPTAVMIVGRPGVFSAGLDIKLIPTLSPDARRETLLAFGRSMLRVFMFPLPTIAAMTGHAIAGGAFLAFGCDLRVMADGPFRLHVNEIAIGITLPTFANVIVESVVDARWRVEMVLHARPHTPSDALSRGFVQEVCAPEQILVRARQLAAPLGALSQTSYAATKQRMRSAAVRYAESALDREMSGA